MMYKVKDDLDVCMNFTNALDHVPEAERNNRTIKVRVQVWHITNCRIKHYSDN
jgi:hypothetical protein